MKKALSLFISLLMVLTLLPVSAIADTEGADPEPEAVVGTTDEQQGPTEPDPEPTEGDAPAQTIEEPQVVVDPETVADPETTEDPETVQAGDGAEPQADEPETYTIYYKANSGNNRGSLYSNMQTAEAGAEVTLKDKWFTKDASVDYDGKHGYRYTHNGWTTKDYTQDPSFTKEYELGGTFTMPAHDVNLYAAYLVEEQYYWTVRAGQGGTFSYNRGSGAYRTELTDQTEAKVYVTNQLLVPPGIYSGFTGVADEGYVFDAWYINDERVDTPTLRGGNDGSFPELKASLFNNGKNVVEARFVAAQNKVTVKYYRNSVESDSYVLYQETVDSGSAIPVPQDPTLDNCYFLGWGTSADGEVVTLPDTLTADEEYYAIWFQGPRVGNLKPVDEDNNDYHYTFHCVDGCPEYSYGFANNFNTKSIWKDGDTFYATIVVDQPGQALVFGPRDYNSLTGKTHKLVSAGYPEFDFIWNETGKYWEPVDPCIIRVTHADTVWTFTGFTWTGSDTEGYTAAVGNYVNVVGETSTVNATMLTPKVTKEATCDEPGETTYTAKIWAANSLDGEVHEEAKTAALPAALGHEWGEVTYEWAEDYSTCTATRVCRRDEEHTETETVTATRIEENDVATYTADFENEAFETQTKEVEIGYYLIGSLTNWQVDEAYKFAPNGAAAGEYILSTTLAVNDEIKAVRAEGSKILTWYPDGTDNNYVVDYAHSGSVNVYFRPDGQGGSDWHHGVLYIEVPTPATYTVIYDVAGLVNRYGNAFNDPYSNRYDETEWVMENISYGAAVPLPSEEAMEKLEGFYELEKLFDGWVIHDEQGNDAPVPETVTGDLVIYSTWVRMPDVDRHNGGDAPSTAFNVNPLGKLICLSEDEEYEIPAKYWMHLDSLNIFGDIDTEYVKDENGNWTGNLHLRYNDSQWPNFINALIEDGILDETHKSVVPLYDASQHPAQYDETHVAHVAYDRSTEMWSVADEDSGFAIEVYCGFQLIYVDNNGESEPFYVKPDENGQATLPAFEGDLTPPVEGAVFLGYRDNWNKPANPGDEGYTRTNANGDPVYSTATFFVPMGVEYLESYPSVPNADDTLFSLTCETDLFEEGHEVPVTYRLLQAAGVTPEFGELDTFNGMYFVQDISLTAAQIDQVLDYLSGEDIQGNGILRDYFLEMRHQLVDEEPLTIQMICRDVDVPEDWAPAAGTGALPGGLSTMGVGGGSDAEPMTLTRGNRTPLVTGGTWEPLAPLMGEEPAALSMRCMVNAFFLNAQADSEAFDWEDPLGYLEENGDEIIFEPCTGMPFLIQDEENGGWMPNPDLEELLSWFAPEALAEELDEEGRALLTNEEGMFFTGWKAMTFAGEEVVPFPEVLDQNLILFPVFEEPRVIICNANVYFEGQIHLSFGFDGDTLPEGGTVRISKEGHNNNDTVQETDVADGVLVNGKMEYYLPVMIPEFADQVTVQVLDAEGNLLPIRSQNGTEYGTEGFHYSVKRYAERKIENGTTAEVRALAQALLDYGTAAQIYFTYGEYTGLSVSELVTGVTAQDLIDGGFAMVTTPAEDRPEGVKASIKVYFESDNTLRITYSGLKGGTTYTYTLDGETVTPASSFLQVEYIAAPNLDVPHTFTISDGTKTFSVQASAMSYALTCIRNGTEARQNLGKAFYLYNQAANAFFETNG